MNQSWKGWNSSWENQLVGVALMKGPKRPVLKTWLANTVDAGFWKDSISFHFNMLFVVKELPLSNITDPTKIPPLAPRNHSVRPHPVLLDSQDESPYLQPVSHDVGSYEWSASYLCIWHLGGWGWDFDCGGKDDDIQSYWNIHIIYLYTL